MASAANPALCVLDAGEREAIQLALELGIESVLMDERKGSQLAERLGLEVRGTLGILERAVTLGKADFYQSLIKLDQTNFRMSPAVRAALMKRSL